jgi:hypothetical protein
MMAAVAIHSRVYSREAFVGAEAAPYGVGVNLIFDAAGNLLASSQALVDD